MIEQQKRSEVLKPLAEQYMTTIKDMLYYNDLLGIEFEIDDYNDIRLVLKLSDIKTNSPHNIDYSEINKPKNFKNNTDFLNRVKPPNNTTVTLKDTLDD